jgi:CRISPR-associated protein Cmr2
VGREEALSVLGHVKRQFSRDAQQGFPSTWSIASGPYRAGIITAAEGDAELRAAVADLRTLIGEFRGDLPPQDRARLIRGSGRLPGMPATDDTDLTWLGGVEGAWCVPWTWDPAGLQRDYDLDGLPDETSCELIRDAARVLARRAVKAGIPELTPYLAVIVQDADHMGERFSEFPADTDPAAWHRKASSALVEAARRQQHAVEASGRYGSVVYAGGDDLLALVPAGTAIGCVRAANVAFRDSLAGTFEEPTASAAIVFFHAAWPLQSAITAAQELIKQAKRAGRPGLGIAVLRRGGERNRVVVPWDDPADPASSMISHVQTLAASMGGPDGGLSGRLASELERDLDALATLSPVWLARELSRRCTRHGGARAGAALLALSHEDAHGRRGVPDEAVMVARFLAAEGAVFAAGVPAAAGGGS